jgi:SAM-dependent methyltransferase
MMSPQAGDSVLDIGSGSGDSAAIILEHYPGVSIVLLDGSPQMVRLLKGRFHGEPRVRFALCHLPSLDGSSVDLGQDRFSFIVLHQSLSELVKSLGSLDELAMWCGRWLWADGQCLLCAHNTVVGTDAPKGFETWKDPFRAELAKKLKGTRYKQYVQEGPHMIVRDQIEAAFTSHSFTLEDSRQEVIELDFEERRRLWHVPAVMDTLVQGGTTKSNELDLLVDDVVGSLKGQKTMPRTVLFWRFKRTGGTPVAGKSG